MSNLDNRIANADQLLTQVIRCWYLETFCKMQHIDLTKAITLIFIILLKQIVLNYRGWWIMVIT